MRQDWVITKRQLGIAFIIGGILAFAGILIVDVLRSHDRIGPSQMLALAACFGVAVLGVTLLPLGDRPA